MIESKVFEIINTSKGKKGYYTILSKASEERMIRNGWRIKITNSPFERDEALVERLLKDGYSQIKLYYSTGKIRGLYDTFAMVKK